MSSQDNSQNHADRSGVHDILSQYRKFSHDELEKGKLFEKMIAKFLLTDPRYTNQLEQVWMWNEWPERWQEADIGIDLVALERDTGNYWAVQCKFYDSEATLNKQSIDSFLATSSKKFKVDGVEKTFSYRLIVSTTSKWGRNAEDVINDQSIPVGTLYLNELSESPIDWDAFRIDKPQEMRCLPKKVPREHQNEAIESVLSGFVDHDRGKLIMACGTGKTLTALRLAEKQTPSNGRVLFLAPSIYLVSQTLREWAAEASDPFHAFVVCSDSKVGKEDEDIRLHDLAYPATTDSKKLANALKQVSTDRRSIVFSTYQSIQTVIDAQQINELSEFDLVICDEAHRTTGLTLPGEDVSNFTKIHDDNLIKASKRLYMTATPRIYNDITKTKAGERDAILYSMDDETLFGSELYRLSFGEAVERNLLSEYKVLIVAVDEARMANLANQYNAYKIDDKKAIDIGFATRIIGSWRGLSKQGIRSIDEHGDEQDITDDTKPMRCAVAFSKSIKASKEVTETFSELIKLYQKALGSEQHGMINSVLHHVDGTMNAAIRKDKLDWLKDADRQKHTNDEEATAPECRILSNARCLSEGIDVPALDAVIFFDTRESMVDIVQSVGRVMRKAPGKQFGYIILPVAIPSNKIKDYNNYIEKDSQFKGIWKVVKALRAHDERLVDEAEFRKRIKIAGRSDSSDSGDRSETDRHIQMGLDFPMLPIEEIEQAVYAAIPKKLGDREYWANWAKDIAGIAEKLAERIAELVEQEKDKSTFTQYLEGLRNNINPGVNEKEAIEMLVQHVITRPIFDALFEGYSFTSQNPIAQAMQGIIEVLDQHEVDSEIEGLEDFYDNVRRRVSLAKSDKSRQDVIKNLYDTFFNGAFPRMAERLGIVYTPIEVVDFIIQSVEVALKWHFDSSVSKRDVHIIDPFTGTGTFMVRLLQSGLLQGKDLLYKYQNDLHANEIVLLAYYIATVNIETAFHAQNGTYQPFNGIALADTFHLHESQNYIDDFFLQENSKRAKDQKDKKIYVVMSNPPYSAKQQNANDNNQNQKYPNLDRRVQATYVERSMASYRGTLYASEIKALRWASDRIGNEGVVAFVTNGSFIDSSSADGLRKCLVDEFSHLYVFNLRGATRTQGEQGRKESANIFGEGSRNTIAILLMVKDPAHQGECQVHYHDIGDYLNREEKLATIAKLASIENISWEILTPNEAGDWINQRKPEFEEFVALNDDQRAIFSVRSNGVLTNRDEWVYNFSHPAVEANMGAMINFYNNQVSKYEDQIRAAGKGAEKLVKQLMDIDPAKIKWSGDLISDLGRLRYGSFNRSKIGESLYRPFCKMWLYYDRQFNERFKEKLFPSTHHDNIAISVMGPGSSNWFSCLITDTIPDLNLINAGQCFPLYWYEKSSSGQGATNSDLFSSDTLVDADGYVRHEAVTDASLLEYQRTYSDTSITKEDIFYHVYGILHAPDYREKFAANLKKMLPRIPLPATPEDFWAFVKAGRDLAKLHLDYETIEPWPLEEVWKSTNPNYQVVKMRYRSKTDKTAIIYNDYLTLCDIPPKALEYVVNGRPVIEWIMERYQVSSAKNSGIQNDPNAWANEQNNPRYIMDLLKRVVRVSVETMQIVDSLPRVVDV
jgi:predicted helicase